MRFRDSTVIVHQTRINSIPDNGNPCLGNSEDVELISSADPRIVAFARLVSAIDASDPRAGIAATRELRRLGLSVCLTTAHRATGGHR
jgi:hypothetical protein